MLWTVETDPQSPFCDPEVPAAEWTWRHVLADACARGPAYLRAWCARAGTPSVPEFPSGPSGQTVDAFVNHGRWMWRCPHCPEAQVASFNDRRGFCCACFNGGAGWHDVRFPDDQMVFQIDVLLSRRQLPNRNWTSSEPLVQLQDENLALGLDTAAPALPASRYEFALPTVRALLTERKQLELR